MIGIPSNPLLEVVTLPSHHLGDRKVKAEVVSPPDVHRVLFKSGCVATATLRCCVLSRQALLTSSRSLISTLGVQVAIISRMRSSVAVL